MALSLALVAVGGCRSGEDRARSGETGAAVDAGLRDARLRDARLRDARAPAPEHDPSVLGRAGPVSLDVEGLRAAVEEARVLQRWRRGEAAPLGALRDAGLRRRVLIDALERRVVRGEVARRGLAVDPARLDELLRLAAVGHRLDAAPTPEQVAAAEALDAELLDARLAARFEAPVERVRRVALDILESAKLAEALLDAVDEAALREAWTLAHTRLVLDVIRVPRVPAPGEIDAAVAARAGEMAAFYEKNRALFEAPERAFLRRVLVPVEPDASPAARAAAKARAEALRARVAGGEAIEAVIAAEAPPREARREGRLTVTRARLPAAFALEVGALSPVEATPGGWHFYRVEGRAPATKRPLDDPRVRREIAASLLREADALPAAKRVAAEAASLLRAEPEGAALTALVAESRARRSTTTPFSPAGAAVVPGIGLAPALHAAVVALTPADPVTPVVTVRQDYVVARLVSREAPDPARWPAEEAAWVASWRAAQRGQVIERWLDEALGDQPTWVDGERLAAVPLAALGATAEALAREAAGAGGAKDGAVDAAAADGGAAEAR
ncbi:MAG: peptidyl-prolyl cis-trans isomerase [Myxococcales bacterium]|nr:peptidyl-prolyl cis-trans isomerase [Myxococcales bacterium]